MIPLRINIDKGLFVALQKGADAKKSREVVLRNATEMQKGAMRLAPVDTGFMKRSITLKSHNGGESATVKPEAEYASYVEYGTRRMSAQPFIRPSFHKQRMIFISDMKNLIK